MTEQEVQEIYNRLLELTKAGKIKWEKTGKEEFTTNFSRSSVTVEVERGWGEQVVLKIFNDAGIIVAYAAPEIEMPERSVDPSAKRFELDPSELFHLVREKVYRYSETSENILNELRELKAS